MGLFFSASSIDKLQILSTYLEGAGYTFQNTEIAEEEEGAGESYLLRIERSEFHTFASLSERELELRSIAARFEVSQDIGFEGLLP